jgi:hypothetical protein
VIVVGADSDYENTNNAQVTLSTGWGVNFAHSNTFMGNVSDGALAGIYAAIPVPGGASPVITVVTNGTAGWRRPSFDIYTVTGIRPGRAGAGQRAGRHLRPPGYQLHATQRGGQ